MVAYLFLLFLAAARVADADVYMHNPRGSNDRNCERNVNRNNGNRLFDRYVADLASCIVSYGITVKTITTVVMLAREP